MAYLRTFLNEIRAAYNESRVKYTEIQDQLIEKEKRFRESQSSRNLTFEGKERKKAVWYEERAQLQGQLRALIADSQKKFSEVRSRAELVYRDKFGIVPENVDPNAMSLLSLGIVSDRELIEMADRYKNNHTMLRVIAKYADDRAQKDRNNMEMRDLAVRINYAGNPHLDAVDSLIFTAEQGLREDRVVSDGIAYQMFDNTADNLIAQYGDICTE
ncbi:MAG: hypothetical protein IKC03_02750 [Oscillospiraceae bacterium]|nr:hypothetical protein [Oscillospiraceae bacterium]